jgi:hypothetical protein
MIKTSLYITLALASILSTGCQPEKKQPSGPSLEGLKITDLIPTGAEKMPSEVNITVFAYDMPAANASVLNEVYKSLPSDFMNFSSRKTFQANGFETGFGYDQIWPQVSSVLARAGARNIGTENLLFMNTATNEVIIEGGYAGQTFYLHKRSGQSETVTLKDGQFSWRVKARALSEKEGSAMVQILPQQKEHVGGTIKKIPGFERTGEHVYHDMSIKAYMSEGDFIIIGPTSEELGQVTLSDILFRGKGDIIVPDIKEGQEPTSDGQMFYKIEKNIPLIRVYVFGCMRVKN